MNEDLIKRLLKKAEEEHEMLGNISDLLTEAAKELKFFRRVRIMQGIDDADKQTYYAKTQSRITELESALGKFIHYDEAKDDDGVMMMLNYNDAIEAARDVMGRNKK